VVKPGVSKWMGGGVKGEGMGGGVPPPAGRLGAAPPENFSNYRCTVLKVDKERRGGYGLANL
jgi:hypothetical protein